MANKIFLTLFQENSYLISKPSTLLPLANKNFLPYFQTLISSFMANKKKFTLFSNPNFLQAKLPILFTKPNFFHGKILYIIYLFFNPNFFHGRKLPMSVTNPNYFHGKTSCISIYKPYFFPWQILPILFGLAPHY